MTLGVPGQQRALGRSHLLVLAAVAGAGLFMLGAPAQAEEKAGGACAVGHTREGKGCMAEIAPAGPCATARQGTVASGGGGGGGGGGNCGDSSIGAASDRFSPTDVAMGGAGGGFLPPAPGPGPGPDLQPGEIGGGGPSGPPGGGPAPGPPPAAPPAAPPVTVIESPAPPDPLPGLFK
jgi:hypothetical protein